MDRRATLPPPGAQDWQRAELATGFRAADGADVDGFLSFSLSVQNRRRLQALENHLEAVLWRKHPLCAGPRPRTETARLPLPGTG